ncbi:hypothetical protein NDI56_12645 [Haloarcula sp. S1CR25-12]|uniref:Putative peptidase inhibitor domain-containing protein n=1 Tax=Haloarcula saliterrae TaxID=2950534 RepID=A0ABU2FEJ4_9EURY|nr:hypothetical protein [Haloarcula sp. S1CR25-12]MDS0260245.1 hypothetical protein [Haloarcula sp. S1CR25-12]
MYVSRAVRSIRDDPIEGESVALALTTADDADTEAVASAAATAGATVERRLQFDDLAVSVPQDRVADLCAIEGLDAVETTDAIAITTADATDEDVEFDG